MKIKNMKIIILFFVLLNYISFSKWEIIKNSNDIFFWNLSCPDKNNCFIAGDANNQNEYIEHTSDGGLTWSQIYSDTLYMSHHPKMLYGLNFPNNNICFVTVDSGVVYKTTNLGVNWDTLNFAKNTIQTIYSNNENFILREEYIYGGIKNKLFYSIDTGNTWNKLEFPKEFDNYIYTRISVFGEYSVFFSLLSEDGEYVFIKTTDSGTNWEVLTGFENIGVKFYNSNLGIARIKCNEVPYQNALKITKDGGKNWRRSFLYENDVKTEFYCGIMNGPSTAFIFTTEGFVYKLKPDANPVEEFFTQGNEISFYPNPLKAGSILKVKNFIINGDVYNIKLYNTIGNVVYENKLSTSEISEGINIPNDISSGLYFLTISGNGFVKTGKIIISDK